VPCFRPFLFFNVSAGQERFAFSSIVNTEEVDLAMALLQTLRLRFPADVRSVAVLTPYKAQKQALERRIRSQFGTEAAASIVVATVDGFQGQEADVVIFSCVRADKSTRTDGSDGQRGVGFLADVRRLNVAITRAQRALWVLGHAPTLQANDTWSSLMDDAKARDLFLEAPRPYPKLVDGMCRMNKGVTAPSSDRRRGEDDQRRPETPHRAALPSGAAAPTRPSGNTDARRTPNASYSKKREDCDGNGRYSRPAVGSSVHRSSSIQRDERIRGLTSSAGRKAPPPQHRSFPRQERASSPSRGAPALSSAALRESNQQQRASSDAVRGLEAESNTARPRQQASVKRRVAPFEEAPRATKRPVSARDEARRVPSASRPASVIAKSVPPPRSREQLGSADRITDCRRANRDNGGTDETRRGNDRRSDGPPPPTKTAARATLPARTDESRPSKRRVVRLPRGEGVSSRGGRERAAVVHNDDKDNERRSWALAARAAKAAEKQQPPLRQGGGRGR